VRCRFAAQYPRRASLEQQAGFLEAGLDAIGRSILVEPVCCASTCAIAAWSFTADGRGDRGEIGKQAAWLPARAACWPAAVIVMRSNWRQGGRGRHGIRRSSRTHMQRR